MQCHWQAGATSDGTQPEEGQGELAGNQGKPGGRGGPEASSQQGLSPGSLCQKLQAGKGRVSLWPPLSQALALKCVLHPSHPACLLSSFTEKQDTDKLKGHRARLCALTAVSGELPPGLCWSTFNTRWVWNLAGGLC